MEADTVVLMITIVGLNITTIGLLMGQMNRLEDRLSAKLDVMGRDVADTRERVAHIEGYLMTFGGFTPRLPEPPPGSQPSAAAQPPPEDPAPDRRQAS